MSSEMTPDEILAKAKSPQQASGDGHSMVSRSADDIIKLNEYAKKAEAKARGKRGGARRIIFAQAILPKHT